MIFVLYKRGDEGVCSNLPSSHKNTTRDHNESIFSSEYIGCVNICICICAYDMSSPHGKSSVLFLAMPLVVPYSVWWCKIAPQGMEYLDHVIYCKAVVYVVMLIYGSNEVYWLFLSPHQYGAISCSNLFEIISVCNKCQWLYCGPLHQVSW